MLSLMPRKDPDQALRIRRFCIAVASYVMWMLLILYGFSQELFRVSLFKGLALFGLFLFFNLVFYGFLRSGFNKRLNDPSLTMPQMVCALLGSLLVVYYSSQETRGTMLLLCLNIFIFGVFRLKIRQFFILSLATCIGYGGVILLLFFLQPHDMDPRIELLNWLVLSSVVVWFSFLGSYLNRLRTRVEEANAELSQALVKIEQMATYDELTRVYNRHQLFRILEHEKALADRSNQPFSICLFDIDYFKKVNDSFGHLTGDQVLRSLVEEVKVELREIDEIARYGGEEFVVILPQTSLQGAEICAQRIRKRAERATFSSPPESLRITISVGVSEYYPVESIDALLARADTALYRAKANGRNRVERASPNAYSVI